jgi:hypothetical protein
VPRSVRIRSNGTSCSSEKGSTRSSVARQVPGWSKKTACPAQTRIQDLPCFRVPRCSRPGFVRCSAPNGWFTRNLLLALRNMRFASRPVHPSCRDLEPSPLTLAEGIASFRWRVSAHNNKKRLMTLPVDEFLRRSLLHVVPPGFVRIRHFRFQAQRCRGTLLPLCLQLLADSGRRSADANSQEKAGRSPRPPWSCPQCGGPMVSSTAQPY